MPTTRKRKVRDIVPPLQEKNYFLAFKAGFGEEDEYEDQCYAFDKIQAENKFWFRLKHRWQIPVVSEELWREIIKRNITEQ